MIRLHKDRNAKNIHGNNNTETNLGVLKMVRRFTNKNKNEFSKMNF